MHSQFRFNRVLKKVPAQSQVRFNRVPEKVPEKVYWKPWCRRGFGAEPGQVQQGSGEGLGGFGAERGEIEQVSEKGSGEGLGGFGAEPTGFP